jgi:hypothetical protein
MKITITRQRFLEVFGIKEVGASKEKYSSYIGYVSENRVIFWPWAALNPEYKDVSPLPELIEAEASTQKNGDIILKWGDEIEYQSKMELYCISPSLFERAFGVTPPLWQKPEIRDHSADNMRGGGHGVSRFNR